MNDSVSKVKTIEPKSRWTPRLESASRRVGHGGTAWSSKSSLKQPQDGSADLRDTPSRITDINTRMQLEAFGGAALVEPEDARLTGGTRSLGRRMLGLNITPRTISGAAAKTPRPAKKVARPPTSTLVA